ncbi:complement C1q tumor necrosis factor-related protein 3-like isoform X1 [Mytilus edulis]|uniref:complement C1q tumor necrosis factor-related protein 3-like isoform X1 n=1 Tax=Mytilus edulis TaxID=6550 RepID=UPI0039EFF469
MTYIVVFLFVSVLATFGVQGSCPPSIGNDVFEDLMNVMLKVKCQKSVSKPSLQPTFFATLTKTVSLGSNAVLKFDRVVTNIGNGYDPKSGVFTVGKSGLYEFAANFISNGDNWLELNLMKNSDFIVKGHSAKAHGTAGSLQAILEVKKGDQIYLRNPRSYGALHGDNYAMFSGHFLQ